MGVLKVKVDGSWVDVSSAADEVAVQPTDPGAGFDLWYDTDATPVVPSPASVVGYAQGPTSNQTGFAAAVRTDITGLALTFTALANRRYRLSATAMCLPVGPGVCTLNLLESTTVLSEAQGYLANSNTGLSFYTTRIWQPTPGAHSIKAAAYMFAGGSIFQSATILSYLMVEDLGPVV